ncbi:MAG: hypothetical protein AAF571_05280 [Verrucomicrobiota bacterium]
MMKRICLFSFGVLALWSAANAQVGTDVSITTVDTTVTLTITNSNAVTENISITDDASGALIITNATTLVNAVGADVTQQGPQSVRVESSQVSNLTNIQINLGNGSDSIEFLFNHITALVQDIEISAHNLILSGTLPTADPADVTIKADDLSLLAAITTDSNTSRTITIQPLTASRPIEVGDGTPSAGVLHVSKTEIELLTTQVLLIGSSSSGDLTLIGDLSSPLPTNLLLQAGGSMINTGNHQMTSTNLGLAADGSLGSSANPILTANTTSISAGSTGTGGVYICDNTAVNLFIISTNDGDIEISAESGITAYSPITAGGDGDITLYDEEDNGITFDEIRAEGNTITITSDGGVIQELASNDDDADLVAKTINLTAAKGIQGRDFGEPLEIDATGTADGEGLMAEIINVVTVEDEGLINIEDVSNNLRVESLSTNANEDFYITAEEDLIIDTVEVSSGPNIFLTAGNVIEVNLVSTTGGAEQLTCTAPVIRESSPGDAAADLVSNKVTLNASNTIGQSANALEISATGTGGNQGLKAYGSSGGDWYIGLVGLVQLDEIDNPGGNITVTTADVVELLDINIGSGSFIVNGGTIQFREFFVLFGDEPASLISSNGFAPGSGTVEAEINDNDDFDYLSVTGPVDISNVGLSVTVGSNFVAYDSNELLLISNDGSDAVTGTFTGIPEGGTVTAGDGRVFAVTYVGGDGNDVALIAPDEVGPQLLSVTPNSTGPTTGMNMNYTLVFSEPVSGLGVSSISFLSSEDDGLFPPLLARNVTDAGLSDTWSVSILQVATTGDFYYRVILDSASSVTDASGNSWTQNVSSTIAPVVVVEFNASDYTNRTLQDTTGGVNDGYLDNADGDGFTNVEEFFFDLASSTSQGMDDYEGKLGYGVVTNGSAQQVFSIILPVPVGTSFGATGSTVSGTLDLAQDITLSVSASTAPGATPDLNVVVNTSPDTTGLPTVSESHQYVEFQLQDSVGTQSKGFMEFNLTVEDLSGELIENSGGEGEGPSD